MRLCVFPNDPLKAYYEKGEIKECYYNPKNFFDEIHFISLTEQDIDVSKIQIMGGNAKIKIHSVGKINIRNRNKHLKKIIKFLKEINPNVIRAYNPLIGGWLAASCAKELKIPFFVSLHTQYDHNRKLAKKNNFKKYLSLKYTEKFIEPFVLETADKIIVVYKIIEPYVLKHTSKKPEILHNRVDCERFANGSNLESLPKPLILSVGSLIQVKNHQCLIEAMERINAHLLIIGNGKLYPDLIKLIKKLGLEKKITIIKSVSYDKIQDYYNSAQFFSLAYNTEVEGLPMPVMEAMASGLPVIIPFPKKGFSEDLEDIAVFSELNPKSFSEKFERLLNNSKLREKFAEKSLCKARDFDSEKIEKREAQIYSDLLKVG